MMKPVSIWSGKKGRREQRDDHIRRSRAAYFGFVKVPESEKVGRVGRHFDLVAPRYDFMNTLLSFGIHYAWKRQAVRRLGLKPGDRVLDVCGGTGDLSIMAGGRIGATGQAVIFDINRTMMQTGRPKVRAVDMEDRIHFIQGNAEVIAFPDASFDAAMVSFGIRNVTHMETAFREMHRILKPGGRIMCLEFSKPTFPLFRRVYDLYSFYVMPFIGQVIAGNRAAYLLLTESIRMFPMPDELAAMLEGVGFTAVTYHRLTNGIAVIHLGVK